MLKRLWYRLARRIVGRSIWESTEEPAAVTYFLFMAVWCAITAAFSAAIKNGTTFWICIICFIVNVIEYIFWNYALYHS